jgi:hypothetical protein
MRIMRFVLWLALPAGALLCGLNGADAQSDEARQACTPDAMRLCSDFIPDVAKITVCMHRKYRQLSPECRAAMRAGSRGRHHGRHRRYRRH